MGCTSSTPEKVEGGGETARAKPSAHAEGTTTPSKAESAAAAPPGAKSANTLDNLFTQAPGSSQNQLLIFPESPNPASAVGSVKGLIDQLARAQVTIDILLRSGLRSDLVKALVSAATDRGVIIRVLTSKCSPGHEDPSIQSLLSGLKGTRCSAKGLQLALSTVDDVTQNFVVIDGMVAIVGPTDLTREGLSSLLQVAVISSDSRVVNALLEHFQITWRD